MKIDLFRMERTQCLYENEVRYNLSESGVQPLRIRELLEGSGEIPALDDLALKYPPSNGSPLLRERIAAFYGDAARDNVLVTTGASEANFTTLWGLLERTDRVAVMLPNYLQSRGLARAFGRRADPFRLVERGGGTPRGTGGGTPRGTGGGTARPTGDGTARWALDVESLHRAVTGRTKIVFVTNPNNPTGAALSEAEMDEIVRAARRAGAWIVSDEVYRGAEVERGTGADRETGAGCETGAGRETGFGRGTGAGRGAGRDGRTSATFWGRYERVIVSAGLSKAFGLPGLRIGWIVGPAKVVARLWSYQDYTTLTPTLVSDRLATVAMEPATRERLLARTRGIIRVNLPRLERWIHSHDDIFAYIPPAAGAIALVRYALPIASEALFDRLRRERSVLITPGSHFGIGRYIRIGYGYDIDRTLEGLAQVDAVLAALRPAPRPRSARPAPARRRAAASSRFPAPPRRA